MDPTAAVAHTPGDGTEGRVDVFGGPAGLGIPGHLTVSPLTGAARYSVPIDMPPGVAGMQPKITLNYSSMSGNGQLGVGWSLGGLDSIVRCSQTIATNNMAGGVNDDGNDRFCLDGQQLIAVPTTIGGSATGAYGADGTHYAKEIDDLTEIISHNSGTYSYSPNWFEVHTKSGLTLEFGNAATSPNSHLLSASGSVVEAWALDKVTDQASNYMIISYTSDAAHGAFYPSQITYAGNTVAGTTGANTITFGWQTRTDTPVLYAAGSPHQTLQRLQSIKTYVGSGSTLVSDYELVYQYGGTTGRSELASLTKYDGSSPQNALPPLTFTWSDAQTSTAKIDVQPDLMTSIANGFGAATNIAYLPETSPTVAALDGAATYPTAPTAPSSSIVWQVQQSVPVVVPAVGGSSGEISTPTESYVTQYSYIAPSVNLEGRGYVGFTGSNAEDLQTGLLTFQLFYQGWPLIGDAAQVNVNIAATSQCVECNTYTYSSATSAQGILFSYLSNAVETRNDIAPGATFSQPQLTSNPALPTITATYGYDTTGPSGDTWGNLTKTVTSTSYVYTDMPNYSTTVANTYQAANTASWLTGLLTNVSVTGQSPSAVGLRTWSYAYNSLGQVTTATIAPGTASNETSTSTYTYDDFGNINSEIVSGADVPSAKTSVQYNSSGQFPNTITNALNQTETQSYDPRFGTLTSDISINDQTTTYGYDTFGRLIKKTNPDGTYSSSSFDLCLPGGISCSLTPILVVGQEFSSANAQSGPTTLVGYDAIGRLVQPCVQSFAGLLPNSSQTEYSCTLNLFDNNGNLAQQSNPFILFSSGYDNPGFLLLTTNTYDEIGRVIATTHPDGSTDTTSYNGPIIIATNGLGQTTTVFKDGYGNVDWTMDSLGDGRMTFAYDGFNDLMEATDVSGNVTSYNYDIRGRANSGSDPDKGNWTASYNSLGEITGTTDAKSQSASMTYDLLGRMTKRTEPDLVGNWTYDTAASGIGELASESASGTASPSGQAGVIGYTKTYSYDSYGRLSGIKFTGPASGPAWVNAIYPESFGYDSSGRPSDFYTDWDHIETNYNTYGYESSQILAATGATMWQVNSRDAAGSLTSATFSSALQNHAVTQNFTYDPNTERMTGITATSATNATLESINYTYDVLGDVTSRTVNASSSEATPLTEYYSYDGLNRLCTINSVSASLPSIAGPTQACINQPQSFYTDGGVAPSVAMTYNSLGNLTTKSDVGAYTYPSGSQPITRPHAVQSIAGPGYGNFTYDADGNMLTSTSNGRTLTYTSFNMVKTATLNGQTVTFYYDADHNRIAQINPQVDTVYMPNMEVTSAPGASSDVVYTYFNDTNGQHIGEIYRTGVTSSSIGNGSEEFFLNDWQNSISVIASNKGVALEADSFDAWGKRRNLNGSPDTNNTITSQSIHGYTNQEELQDAQLIDLNARMYDPYLGVMLSVDPMVAEPLNQQTWNAYSYAANNPMHYTDPTGKQKAEGDGNGTEVDGGGGGGGGGGESAADEESELATAIDFGIYPSFGSPGASVVAAGQLASDLTTIANAGISSDLSKPGATQALAAFANAQGSNNIDAIDVAAANFASTLVGPTSEQYAENGESDESLDVAAAGGAVACAIAPVCDVVEGVSLGLIAAKGLIVDAADGIVHYAAEGAGETFFRTMSSSDFETLNATGQIPATSETFVSPSLSYAQSYNGVTVQFTVNGGTTDALANIGVRDGSNAVLDAGYGDLPMVSSGWNQTSAFFKGEGGIVNIGLGQGPALDLFNGNIQSFMQVP